MIGYAIAALVVGTCFSFYGNVEDDDACEGFGWGMVVSGIVAVIVYAS